MILTARIKNAVTHLGVRERIPVAVAHLTAFGEPNEYPIHLEGAIRVGPASDMAAGLSQVRLAVGFLTTGL